MEDRHSAPIVVNPKFLPSFFLIESYISKRAKFQAIFESRETDMGWYDSTRS